jgi:L-aspartate oxidase
MGGIAVDEWGRTSLENLWACGETSATGVHGANRLASNSLLEALVYGSRVATDIVNPRPWQQSSAGELHSIDAPAPPQVAETTGAQALRDLRNLMYANVGLVRDDVGLRAALTRIAELESTHAGRGALRNLLVVGRLIAEAALVRTESRGSHYRTDYPRSDAALAKRSFTRLASVA